MDEVFGEHGFADTVRADQHDVGGFADKLTAQQLGEQASVDVLGPVPIEVGQVFEGAELGVAQASRQRTALTLVLFESDELLDPRLAERGVILAEQAEQSELMETFSPRLNVSRCRRHCRRLP